MMDARLPRDMLDSTETTEMPVMNDAPAPVPLVRARGFAKWMLGVAAGTLGLLMLSLGAPAAQATERGAQADPPGRVGRIVEMQGNVSRYDADEGRWSDAERNRPLTTGDRLSTAGDARVELRVGSTVLRLGGGTELEVLRLDDERLAFELHDGELALRVRTGEKAAEIEVVTREARLLPLRAGHYRIDRQGDVTFAGAWRGDLRVDGPRRLTASTGQRLELSRDERSNELRHVWRGLPDDAFASWVLAEDRHDERQARTDHVSPEMTGAEDLDRWGSWDRHPEYGAVWTPREVAVGWAPYRHGRWVWVSPWGWTWVDEARWGFAPFHYGRWVYWGQRWCWAPGGYVHRPVYAPALVAWVGGSGFSVSVHVGGPAVGWVPLAPRERYVPYYRATPVYIDRVNLNPRFQPRQRQPGQPVPTGPIAYSNQGVPGAVTVVPRDVLVRREPVARAVIQVPEVHRAPVGSAPPVLPAPPVVGTPPAAGGRLPPPPYRDAMGDDGRGGRPGPDRRDGRDDRRDGRDLREGPGARDGRDGRDARDGREGDARRDPREGGRSGRDARDPREPVQVVPRVQPLPPRSVAPAAPATPSTPSTPAAQPPAPRVAPAPRPGATTPPPPVPVQRAPQNPPPRAERGDDDRKRSTPAPRHGEREREASR